MRVFPAAVFLALSAMPAHAQRDAVSADLSPETAGQVFSRTVASICVPAVSGYAISELGAVQEGKLKSTRDAETRKQAGASPDETVWDVMEGKGVVTVREKAGQCVVSVYGAPAKATVAATAEALKSVPGAKGVSTRSTGELASTTRFEVGPRSVLVNLEGSEPGSPRHQSKFSVVTGTVLRGQ